MRKTLGDPYLLPVCGAQDIPNPLSERGGILPHIDGHVENLPLHDPHELALGLRRYLIMQSTHDTLP